VQPLAPEDDVPPSQNESDASITQKLDGVDKDIDKSGTSEDSIINSAFGHKVIRNGLPPIDVRQHDEFKAGEMMEMGS